MNETISPVPTPAELDTIRARIIADRAALAAGSWLADPDLWARVRGHESEKRAICVAAVQGHSVAFMGPESELCRDLAAQAGVAAAVVPVPAAGDDAAYAAFLATLAGFDIHCEAPASLARDSYPGRPAGTSLARVLEQVKAAKLPDADRRSANANSLFAQYVANFTVPDAVRSVIWSVARSVAALGRCDEIGIVDVSEACTYRLDRK